MADTAIRRIPLAQPWIGDRERALVDEVLSSGVLALGPYARAFEEAIARLAGRRFGVSCSSGTAGSAHGGPRRSGSATATRSSRRRSASWRRPTACSTSVPCPDFVDIEEDSLGIDPDLVAGGRRRRGPGRSCRSTSSAGRAGSRAIEVIARARGWAIIEDCLRGARLARRTAGRSAASATSRSSRSIRTSRSPPARAAWSSPMTRRSPT